MQTQAHFVHEDNACNGISQSFNLNDRCRDLQDTLNYRGANLADWLQAVKNYFLVDYSLRLSPRPDNSILALRRFDSS